MRLRGLEGALIVVAISIAAAGIAYAADRVIEMEPGDTLTVECSTRLTGMIRRNEAELACRAIAPVVTATGTAVATVTRTATSIATATQTAVATATRTPTSVATATGTPPPGGGVPICTDHSPTVYHGLVKRSGSAIQCTYEHTHFDNPHDLDSTFGALQYGEISYPWMTANENAYATSGPSKHNFYKWDVVNVNSCRPSNASLGMRRIRAQFHADANAGATTRYHSFFVQAELCDPNDASYAGKVTVGGHMDYGVLIVGNDTFVPLPGDPSPVSFGGARRLHGSVAEPRYDWTWYGMHGLVANGIRHEDWGPVDPDNLSRQLYYGSFYPGTPSNHSFQESIHLLHMEIPINGNKAGFANRYGQEVAACSPVGPDCVPFSYQNVKAGTHQFRADTNGLGEKDYDVKGPDGQSLLRWPN